MKALVLLVFAIILSAAVLIGAERLGYLMPSQEPEAYAARLVVANVIVSKRYEESFGPSSSVAKSMDETVLRLQQKYPEIVTSNWAEVNRIHELWRVKNWDFLREAYGYFFAKHFTTAALERMRNGRQAMLPDVRAMVVWYMHKGEFDLIADRAKDRNFCLLYVDVLPALAAIGVTEFGTFEEEKDDCELLIAAGLFDPKNAILKPSDLTQ